jgi:retron-type reverse transcriptase
MRRLGVIARKMKRIGGLYEQICSIENINLAYTRAKKNKKNSYGVRVFDKDVEGNINMLFNQLKNNTYRTGAYFVFKVRLPKEREIYRLDFRHRVVHHAVMNVLEPIWVSVFTGDTYSCIKGKGIHACVMQLKHDLKDVSSTQYCLKIDIKKFYPNIDHDVLKNIIRRKIKCVRTLRLLDEVIDSAPGVPIGNYLSQYFANLYLAYFDHWIKETKMVKYYYRYCDDIVILGANKDKLHMLLKEIEEYLKVNLKLTVKKNYQVFPVDARGIDFVGYVFRHTHIKLRKSIKKAMVRKRNNIKSMASYYGWCKHCNSKNLLKKLNINESTFRQSSKAS